MKNTTTDHRNSKTAPPDVIIFGSGACAQKIAANFSYHGIHAWVSTNIISPPPMDQSGPVHWLTGIELSTCHGFAGNFKLNLMQKDSILHQNVPAIVIAEDDDHSPNYAPYGLAPHSRILSITSLEEQMKDQGKMKDTFHGDARIAFLCGWEKDCHPAIAQQMIEGCRRLQNQSKMATYFLTGNLKVAAEGAEASVFAAKQSGTIFLKFTHHFPTIEVLADGRFAIDYLDELTRTPFQFKADWIVVDETIGPGHRLMDLAQKLGVERDGIGFAQCDNVRRLSNSTNRRGIFVAGGSRGIFSKREQLDDADRVTLNVMDFLQDIDREVLPQVQILRGRCARCLTCHRLCPHHAIDIGSRISVVTEACQSCGICMAGCPARAIEMEGVHLGADIQGFQPSLAQSDPLKKIPWVIVFGCTRSAGRAHELCRLSGLTFHGRVQFVEVPCGGTISSRHLLAAFDAGVGGAILCTCHTGNCQSEIGNQMARQRVESARELLTAAGVEKDRLEVASVAANMGNEFNIMINAFVDRIGELNGS